MKKIICFTAVIFSLITVFSAVASPGGYYRSSGTNDAGQNYINDEVPLFMEKWEEGQFLSRVSKEAVNPINGKPLKDVDVLCNTFRETLGNLRKIRDTELLQYKEGTTESGSEATAQYQIFAKFDKGEAEIIVRLKKVSEEWVITYFFVSPILLYSEEA